VSEAKMARAVSVIAPWLALGAGVATARLLAGRRPWQGAALAAAVAACALPSAARAWGLAESLRSGYPEALRFVAERSAQHLTSHSPISAAELGSRSVARLFLPRTSAELAAAVEEGARYLILDWEKHLWYSPLLAGIERSQRPVLVVDNPCVRFPALLHESYLPADVRALRARDKTIDKVLVYDLAPFAGPAR
jgi:hypothetical protein